MAPIANVDCTSDGSFLRCQTGVSIKPEREVVSLAAILDPATGRTALLRILRMAPGYTREEARKSFAEVWGPPTRSELADSLRGTLYWKSRAEKHVGYWERSGSEAEVFLDPAPSPDKAPLLTVILRDTELFGAWQKSLRPAKPNIRP